MPDLYTLLQRGKLKKAFFIIEEANYEKSPLWGKFTSQIKANLSHREIWGLLDKKSFGVILWTQRQ